MNEKLVWFTGAPGSKWSGSANILQAITKFNFNLTDRTPEREYQHTGPTPLAKGITHTGAYFGPGHGLGENFHQLDTILPSVVEEEILSKWQDSSWGYFLVKSHFFTHQLDYISSVWPNNTIIMITRPNEACIRGWFGAGGWDISYPDYRPYYKDDTRMKQLIAEHNAKIFEFCSKHNVAMEKLTANYLKEKFNWTVDDIPNLEHRAWVYKHLVHTEGTDDVKIAIYNFKNLSF